MKQCSTCKEHKALDQYSKNIKAPDKLSHKCKACQSAYYKAYNASRKVAQPRVEVNSKVCRECGLEKPISQFGIKATSLDKHNIYCKPCWRVRTYAAIRRQYGR